MNISITIHNYILSIIIIIVVIIISIKTLKYHARANLIFCHKFNA